MDTLNVTDRFDGADHWSSLSVEDQDKIGAAAIEWIAADNLRARAHVARTLEDGCALASQWERVGLAATEACRSAIRGIIADALPLECMEAPDGAPRVASLLGMVCQECGCSELDACPGRCGWARDNLCTSCAQKAVG